MLDVGCGSGILSIAALKLGAASALALDVSAVAVEATRANADANCVGDRLEARVATLDGAAGEPYLPLPPDVTVLGAEVGTYDLVLANIIARVIGQLAPALARAVHAWWLADRQRYHPRSAALRPRSRCSPLACAPSAN